MVFRGDTIPIECKATYLDESQRIVWFKNDQTIETNEKLGIIIEDEILEEQALIRSTLTVHHVQANSSKDKAWEFTCRVMTSRGNAEKKVMVLVMDVSAPYCQPDTTVDNKGISIVVLVLNKGTTKYIYDSLL